MTGSNPLFESGRIRGTGVFRARNIPPECVARLAGADLIFELDSLEDHRLDPYRDLQLGKRARHQDWFVAEGRWLVERLLASDYKTQSVVLGHQVADHFVEQIPAEVDTLRLPRELVSRLVGFEFHSGIVACGRRDRKKDLSDIAPLLQQDRATVVVCPFTVLAENLGSIIRLCSGFGVDALVVGPQSVDPFARRVIRVSMGNIFQLPIVEPDSVATAVDQLRREFGFQLLAATGSPEGKSLPQSRPARRIAVVLGNEARGIPPDLVQTCDWQISIPLSGETDSLNVANALAVILYQFVCVDP